jgi:hypothetical protein
VEKKENNGDRKENENLRSERKEEGWGKELAVLNKKEIII